MNKLFLGSWLLLLLLVVPAMAQDVAVTGSVTSSDDGSPLPGVSVQVKGTSRGISTDATGKYQITVPSKGVLVFSFIGYVNREVIVNGQTTVNVALQADATNLNEVVVTGYGTQLKREITGSISSISAKQIADLPITSLEQSFQGRAAGVQVTQNSGTPGGGIAVRIRGSSSISASNEPLYVVDGIPINTGSYSGIGVGGAQQNALSNLNPSDIESFEILKDAAAAAIYGSRAANGVVLITTKTGKAGTTQIDVNANYGTQSTWKRYTPLSGPQFTTLLNEMVSNRYPKNAAGNIVAFGTSWPTYGDLTSAIFGDGNDTNGFRDPSQFNDPTTVPTSTNWYDQVFRNAPISQTDVSIRGGNERTKFYISAGRFDQQGIIVGSGFNRLSSRINVDQTVNKNLTVGAKLSLSRAINNRIQNDNNIYGVLSTAVLLAPDVPVYNKDGSFGRDPSSSVENPLAAATLPKLTGVELRTLGSAYLDWKIPFVPGLSLRSTASLDLLNFREDQFNPSTALIGRGVNGQGRAQAVQDLNWLAENYLTYRKTTLGGNLAINALAGASWQQDTYESVFASATNFPGNAITRLGAGSVKTDASSNGTSWGFNSYFTRLGFDYKNRYQLQASARYDGSSRFGANNRYGLFPSISGGWRIIEEPFMKNQRILTNLNIRGGYGITGNSNIGNFGSLGLYGVVDQAGSNVRYLQSPALAPTQIANPDLKWEKTSQSNIAIEFGFLSRFNFSAEYYYKYTTDLLLNQPIPATSGFTNYLQNSARLENKGFEFTLSSQNINTGGFRWTTDANIAFNRNKVLSLADGVPPFGSGFASWVAVGEPIGAFRGYVTDGIFQTQDQVAALNAAAAAKTPGAVYQSTLTSPGDIRFKDLNGDGRVTSDDQQVLGSAQPKFFGGITNTFSYAGFDLSVFYQFVNGNLIFNDTRAFSEGMNSLFGQTSGVLNRWTPTNTNTTVPRALYADPVNNRRNSDRWLEDGSYGRIKNVVLGYTVPKAVLQRLKIRSIRAYVQGQNLLTFTKYSGLDPEVNTFSGSNTALGTDFLTFPQARTVTFGLNLGF